MQAPNVVRKLEMRPVGDKIVVQPVKPEKITKGGIIIPDTAKRPPRMGIVVAVGPGRSVENPMPIWLSKCWRMLLQWLADVAKIHKEKQISQLIPEYSNFIPNPVKVGDKVLFHKFSGTEIQDTEDNQVVIMCVDDILAIVDPELSHCHCTCHQIHGNGSKYNPPV